MDYRVFTLRFEGIFNKKILIEENEQLQWTAVISGAMGNLLTFNTPDNKSSMHIDKPKWHDSVRVFYVDREEVCKLYPPTFSSNYDIDSHYGKYHVNKDSIMRTEYTISNSTSEIAKISKKGIFSEQYGIAIHSNEHVPFLLALSTFVIYRLKQQQNSGG
jgi:hypothetical protein